MARLYVYRDADDTLVVDCQSDLLDHLRTRLVAPLLDPAGQLDPRLNPAVTVEGREYVFAPQFLATVPVTELRQPIAWLRDDEYAIGRAIDLMLGGV
jgi:toxin CcdB